MSIVKFSCSLDLKTNIRERYFLHVCQWQVQRNTVKWFWSKIFPLVLTEEEDELMYYCDTEVIGKGHTPFPFFWVRTTTNMSNPLLQGFPWWREVRNTRKYLYLLEVERTHRINRTNFCCQLSQNTSATEVKQLNDDTSLTTLLAWFCTFRKEF